MWHQTKHYIIYKYIQLNEIPRMQPKPQQVFCKIILGPYFVHISEFTAEYVSQGISQLVDIFPSEVPPLNLDCRRLEHKVAENIYHGLKTCVSER